jgi:hypothetical protein
LWCFVVVVGVFLGFFSPLMRQWQKYFWDTISSIGGWGTSSKIIKTETLLHLNLKIFLYFLFLFLLFLFYFFSQSLCLSNVHSTYCWLVQYHSLFISLKLLFFTCLFVFPFFFPFFAFPLLSPFHSKYHHCYYYKLENT